MGSQECIDPFGAPEIFVDGVAYREMVGTEVFRSAFYTCEHGQRIVRVKLLIPVAQCLVEWGRLHAFLQERPTGALVN